MQGALRAAQHFHPFQVVELGKRHIGANNHIIPIDVHGRSGARLRVGADAAQGNAGVTCVGRVQRQAGCQCLDIAKTKGGKFIHRIA